MKSDPDKMLHGSIHKAKDLDETKIHLMYLLMNEFYHASEEVFIKDLQDKDRVILLNDGNQNLRGFTTSRLFDLQVANETLKILFSGDTIIHPDYWGTLELPRIWGKFMLDTLAQIKNQRLFWFLISSGYKTYRFLPAYFNDFFPRNEQSTPPEMQSILDTAAGKLFGANYNQKTGIIKLNHPTPLKSGVADPGQEKQKNPHVAYFLQKNPGYNEGDELACLAELHTANIKPFVKRLLNCAC